MPALNLAVDIKRGETAIGEKMEFSVAGIRRELFNRFTPLISQDIVDAIREQQSWVGSAITPLVWFGIGAQSYTTQSVRTAQLIGEDGLSGRLPDFETYDDPPQKISELTSVDQEAFLELHPDIREELEERSAETVGGLGEREQRSLFGAQIGIAQETVREGLDRTVRDVSRGRFGEMSEQETRTRIWDDVKELFSQRRGAIDLAERTFEGVVAERDEREALSGPQRAIQKFFEVNDRHERRITDEDWAAFEADLARSLTSGELREVERQLGVGDHELERAWHSLNDGFDEYYALPEQPTRRRESWRRANPDKDADLWLLGRVSRVMSRDAQQAAVARAQSAFGITLSLNDVSMGGRRGGGAIRPMRLIAPRIGR
jgi:hypothetical protein